MIPKNDRASISNIDMVQIQLYIASRSTKSLYHSEFCLYQEGQRSRLVTAEGLVSVEFVFKI